MKKTFCSYYSKMVFIDGKHKNRVENMVFFKCMLHTSQILFLLSLLKINIFKLKQLLFHI